MVISAEQLLSMPHLSNEKRDWVVVCMYTCTYMRGLPTFLQNLLRHLKLVEDESNQVVYEGRKPPLTNAAVDLQR